MTFEQLQKLVESSMTEDQKANTIDERGMFLTTETGEVIKELLKLKGLYGVKAKELAKQRVGEELADVIWNVCDIANRLGLNLAEVMLVMLQKHGVRNWVPAVREPTMKDWVDKTRGML
jgi:NTP pyrophosphatase (non-canonical NTP hydrolase)